MVGGLAVAGHVLFATSMAGTTIDAFHFAAVPRVPHVAFAHAHRIAHAFGNATAVVHATSSRAHFAVAFLSVGSTVGVATGPHGIGFAQALHVAIDRFTRTTRAVARGGTTRPRFLRGGGTRDGIRRGHHATGFFQSDLGLLAAIQTGPSTGTQTFSFLLVAVAVPGAIPGATDRSGGNGDFGGGESCFAGPGLGFDC